MRGALFGARLYCSISLWFLYNIIFIEVFFVYFLNLDSGTRQYCYCDTRAIAYLDGAMFCVVSFWGFLFLSGFYL